MKFLFVLVFCFCSLFGRTFDDVIDEKHEQLMLEVYKGQETRYYNIKAEIDRRIAKYPKEYLFMKNCFTKITRLGFDSVPKECSPNYNNMYNAISTIFPVGVFEEPQEALDIFATHLYISFKLRGTKIYDKVLWFSFFLKSPDLRKKWIKACRDYCGLTQEERAYDTYDNSKINSNTSPATSTSRRNY